LRPAAPCPQVLATLQRSGLDPDIVTYNSLIKAAAAARLLPEARQLYRDLRAARLRPTTFTFAALFTAAARAGASDAAWLLATWDEMLGQGVEPNEYVVSALLAAASHAPCTPAQLDRLFGAVALLRRWGVISGRVRDRRWFSQVAWSCMCGLLCLRHHERQGHLSIWLPLRGRICAQQCHGFMPPSPV
jgi:pentatricopeptide repeat protein